jgi:RHS repeat-associated protein
MSWTSTNSSPVYDAAGDLKNDGSHQYLYDAEGRVCEVMNTFVGTTTAYLYDADGVRVSKGTATWGSCNPATNGFQPISDYVLGPSGEQVTEVSVNSSGPTGVEHTNIWAGSMLVATYDASDLHFYLTDPLGTRRAQTNHAGTLEQTCESLPFGDYETCSPAPAEQLFTGKERDAESGNDYFGARYYASTMGRFLSPDWSAKAEPVPYARLDDPQSLNLYVYGGNNPLIHIDADGHCWPQWLCTFVSNTVQRFQNSINYGFITNAQVDQRVRQGSQNLRNHGFSPEGLSRMALANAAGRAGKTWQTYIKRHPNLEPYSGRTSGTGTPEENIQLRDRTHHMNEQGYGEAELDKSSSNPDAIRGREQQLIEANGGAQSQGGTSGNAINGISESNPNRTQYMNAANAEFGAVEGAETGAEGTIEVIEIMNDLSDIP